MKEELLEIIAEIEDDRVILFLINLINGMKQKD